MSSHQRCGHVMSSHQRCYHAQSSSTGFRAEGGGGGGSLLHSELATFLMLHYTRTTTLPHRYLPLNMNIIMSSVGPLKEQWALGSCPGCPRSYLGDCKGTPPPTPTPPLTFGLGAHDSLNPTLQSSSEVWSCPVIRGVVMSSHQGCGHIQSSEVWSRPVIRGVVTSSHQGCGHVQSSGQGCGLVAAPSEVLMPSITNVDTVRSTYAHRMGTCNKGEVYM